MIQRIRAFFTSRPVLRAVVVALVPLLVFGLVMEAKLRSFVAGTSRERTSEWTEFRPHPTMFWRLRPNLDVTIEMRDQKFHVTTNEFGLRGVEVPFEKPANGWRAWCLGDSITYGYGVDDGQTYEARLQDLLQTGHPDRAVAVLNGGCPGWSSFQARQLTEEVGLKYHPDLYVLGFTYADPAFEDATDAAKVDSNPLIRWLKLGLNQSELYLFARKSLLRRSNPQGLPDADYMLRTPRVPEDEYRANLQWFAEIARATDAHVVVLSLAKRDPDPHEQYARFRAIAREVAESTGNAFLDVDALFSAQPDPRSLFSDRIHPNAAGFDLMARAIADVVQERGWIK